MWLGSFSIAERKKGERNKMKTKRKVTFGFIALLMLTVLAITSIVPGGANPGDWDWASGSVHYHCKEPSNRSVSICTWPTDNKALNITIPYGCQQYYDVVYDEPVGGLVNITVPKGSYHSDPFYLKELGPGLYAWCQVYLVDDGNGTLSIVDNVLHDVDISITATGDGTGNFTTSVVPSGGPAPAGSEIVFMPLDMDVWLGVSDIDPTVFLFLFTMDFPMWVTTGFIETRIIDAYAFPNATQAAPQNASVSMDGYYMNATGVRFDAETGAAVLVGAGAGLDIYANIPVVGDVRTDNIFVDFEVIEIVPPPVGGVWIPVDKLALLAPYIGLASTIILAVAATAIFFKYRKKP